MIPVHGLRTLFPFHAPVAAGRQSPAGVGHVTTQPETTVMTHLLPGVRISVEVKFLGGTRASPAQPVPEQWQRARRADDSTVSLGGSTCLLMANRSGEDHAFKEWDSGAPPPGFC